ncbi:MAG: hypothetical protein LBT59_20150, partial [Clostridiales bacterium]|nr:hypothetical protein [Clostridiales bacterium]
MKSLVSNYIRFAVKRHKLVVLLAIALLAASLALASDLSVDSSMQGILPENNEIITAMTIMDEEFGSQDDIIVAVKSGGSRETVISFLDALAQGISEKGLAKSLIYKIDLGGEITYLVSDSGNLYLMNISPNIDFSNLVEDRERFFAGMQEVLDKTLAMPQFAGLEAGMTGGNLIQDFES